MKIGTQLIAGFLIFPLLTLFTIFFVVNVAQNAMVTSIASDSKLIASTIMNNIDRNIYDSIGEFQVLAKKSELIEFVKQSNSQFSSMESVSSYIDNQDEEWKSTPKEEITPFMKELLNNEMSYKLKEYLKIYESTYGYNLYSEVFITNKYGANIAQTGKTSDYRQDDEDWWQLGKENKIYVFNVEYDESADVYSTDIIIRIEDYDGNFIGVMKVVLNIDYLININNQVSLPKEEVSSIKINLVSEDNKILFSTKPFERFENISERMREHINEDKNNQMVKTGSFKLKVDETEKLISYAASSGYSNFNGLGWIIIVEYDSSEIFEPIYELRNKLIAISIFITFIALLLAIIISNSISNPIKKLTKVVEDISTGKLDTQIESNLKDANNEIGQLAKAFDRTIVSLKLAMRKSTEAEPEKVKK